MADAQNGRPGGEKDSPLSMTSNILGIFTFAFALGVGAWIRIQKWTAAGQEFSEFEKYVDSHNIEFKWMLVLLKPDRAPNLLPRPSLPYGSSSYSSQETTTIKQATSLSKERRAALKDKLLPKTRFKTAGQYFIYKRREDRLKANHAVQALRYLIIEKKRKDKNKCENDMFREILSRVKSLDSQLQNVVNRVRETVPLAQLVADEVTRHARGAASKPPNIPRHEQLRHARLAPTNSQGANGAARRRQTPAAIVHQTNGNGSNSAQNGTHPSQQSHLLPPPVQANRGQTPKQSLISATAQQERKKTRLRKASSEFFHRVASHFLQNHTRSWIASWIISMNWLRHKEEARQLQKELDILWNRIHASQLALISRRLDDQDDCFEMLLKSC